MSKGDDEKSASTEDRIRVAETLLLQRVRIGSVVAHLVRTYGVSERQAQRYVAKVREGWRRGAPRDVETREARRDEVRATIDEVIRLAMQRRKPLRGPDGGPVFAPGTTDPIMVPEPDLRAALHGLRLAMQLDALEAPDGRLVRGLPSGETREETREETIEAEVVEVEASTAPTPAVLAARLKGEARRLIAIPGGRREE